MARKNILSGLLETPTRPDAEKGADGSTPERTSSSKSSALGAVTRSISDLTDRAHQADRLREQLEKGESIVDVDTKLIDSSFVSDRNMIEDEEFSLFMDAIREQGQHTPVLLRPHPEKPDRYQTVYGHRRVRAAHSLGIPVRAIIRSLADRDHVIAQGQENAARADLSFIEQAMFAARLEKREFDRQTIITAMNSDKTTISKMMSVITRIPDDIIAVLLNARSVGRNRWYALAARFEESDYANRARACLTEMDEGASDEDRFAALEALRKPRQASSKTTSRTRDIGNGSVKADISAGRKKFTLALKSAQAPAFGAYLENRLDTLFEEFEAQDKQKGN